MSIQIHIDDDRTAFRPRETITGSVSWSREPVTVLDYAGQGAGEFEADAISANLTAGAAVSSLPVAPTQVSLELFWTTRGKGTVDSEVVQSKQIKNPGPAGQERFSLTIPTGPYSFSGKLVSLLWGLRLIIHPSQEQTQVNLTISPTGQEINLVG